MSIGHVFKCCFLKTVPASKNNKNKPEKRVAIIAIFGFFELSIYNCLAIIVSKYTLVVEGGSLNELEAINLTHHLIPFEGYE